MSSANGPAHSSVPLAIIGIGCMFPKAGDARAYWLNIKNGVDGIGPVPPSHWNPDDYLDPDPKSPDRTYAARGGFLSPVDFRPLDFGIAPNDLEATDTSQLLGLVAARNALLDAGYGPQRAFNRSRVSVILGVTGTLELVIPLGARLGHPRWKKALANAGVSEEKTRQIVDEIGDSYVGWQENSFPGLLGNVVAGRIANRLDLGGTNCVVDAACASSLSAIHLAGLELASGRCDLAVSGGVDTFNDIFMFMCFSKTPALSPSGDAKPFDAKGDGTILGEGLGIVVLKRLADAERDGDRVYAVIRGLGSSSDGKGNAIYAPSAAGQTKALHNAYELAGVTPDTIELVEAHGTGTRVGDGVEVSALTEVYRQAKREGVWCALGSVKSQIGHTKAAAGAAGLIKAALALHHKVLPPTIKVSDPIDAVKPGRSPFYVNTEKRPWISRPEHPRRAAVSAFGFGGSNFHCVLEEYCAQNEAIDWDGDVEIIAISAANSDSLLQKLDGWNRQRSWPEIQREAAASRAEFSTTHERRLLLVVHRHATDLTKLVDSALAKLNGEPEARFWKMAEGAYFGSGPTPGRLAVVFPGQGSQYAGMLRDLACSFPAMREVLADANRVFARMTSNEQSDCLSDSIFPYPPFSREEREEQERRLRRTDIAQPAIGAVSLGALKIIEAFGVQPEAYAGHSYGELPALCAAGCFDAESLHKMSRLRGHLMASYHGANAGSMLAVHAPLQTIETVLREEALDLVVANRNAPAQSVLSGRREEIERAIACLDRRKVHHTQLSVAAAFHSPLVAAAKKPFREALDEVEFRSANRPVFANTSGQSYPRDTEAIRELLGAQLACPVEFVREISGMADSGIRTFLEVGPGSTLTKLIGSILGGSEQAERFSGWDAFALDSSNGKRSGTLDLAHALARLAAHGHALDLRRWRQSDDGTVKDESQARPGLVVPISGANYVAPKAKKHREIEKMEEKIPLQNLTPSPIPKLAREDRPSPTVLVSRDAQSSERSASDVRASPGPSPKRGGEANQEAVTQALQNPPSPKRGGEEEGLASVPSPKRGGEIDPEALTQALQVTRQSLAAFQQLQEQTAQLHRQFLESQEAAQRTLQMLVEQQHSLLLGGPVKPIALPAIPRPLPPATSRATAPVTTTPPQAAAPVSRNGDALANGEYHAVTAPGVQPHPAPAKAAPTKPRLDTTAILLGVVAEKTGYPAEMLTPEMALDADLGIDSIKRVEIFSTLQERLPEAPVVKPEHLGNLQTLADVIEFLSSHQAPPSDISTSNGKAPAALAPSHSRSDSDKVATVLFAVVAEKTGYPTEMLNAEMALDADLGIDSIKRVEIFSALQERLPDAPIVKPEHLGTLHSLGDVAAFLSGQNGTPVEAEAAKKKLVVVPSTEFRVPSSDRSNSELGTRNSVLLPADGALIERSVLRAVPLPKTSSLSSVQLATGSTIVIVGNETAAARTLKRQIEAAHYRVRMASWTEPPDQVEVDADGLLLVAPSRGVPNDIPLRAFRWLRRLGPSLRSAGEKGGAILATVTQFDGAFGLNKLDGRTSAHAGALAGLAKTAAREWPNVACKAIDLEPGLSESRMDEVWRQIVSRGQVEIGFSNSGAITLTLVNEPIGEQQECISSSAVVLITGGARGVTSTVAQVIAENFKPTLVLMGRTDLDIAEPVWLRDCTTEAAVKQALVRNQSPAPAPKAIEAEYRKIIARREALDNIARMKKTGARVVYRAVDVADAGSVAAALIEIRDSVGPVTHLIHGAGTLADRRIDDLTDEQFQQVYSSKVTGLEAILQALAADSLKAIVLFSSSTGRFGRTGQAAYAAANEALNKMAQQQARLLPDCKVVAMNWGPWDGGMVTPALRKIFESEGVGVIPLRQGAEVLMAELGADKSAVEVTLIAKPATAELATPASSLHVVFESEVSVRDFPILRSHVIDGRSVLPLVLHLELLAHAALHGNPGLVFHGVNDLRVFNGVVLDGDESARLKVLAGKAEKGQTGFVVGVELLGKRGPREVVHSRADVLLVPRLPASGRTEPLPNLAEYPYSIADAYGQQLFHGPDLAGIEKIEGIGPTGIVGLCRTAPPPATWLRQPLRSAWIADPLLIDAAFQMMILWSVSQRQAGCLPCFVGQYRQYRRSFPAGVVRIQVRVKQAKGALVKADIEFVDTVGDLVAEMRDHESVIDENLNRSFRQNRFVERV